MSRDSNKSNLEQITRIVTVGLGLSWFELIGELWKLGRKIARGLANEGMYEVLDHETTLEILDRQGKKATVKKRQTIRFLQDNNIAYQDKAWGDGKILIDYKCSPGYPVDEYRLGHKTHILISLREVKNKGEEVEFNIQWTWRNGLVDKVGFWGTFVDNRTRRIKVNIIFPKSRLPLKVSVTERNRKRTQILEGANQMQLPDGRWMVSWEKEKPKMYENYLMKWEW